MAAFLPISCQSVFDERGARVTGAVAHVYLAGGTSEPAPVYVDADFSAPLPNPVPMRGNGTWPLIWVDAGNYRVYIVDRYSTVVDDIDGITIAGASNGDDGGGGEVDQTAIAQTGDVKDRYGTGAHTGWVRCNGRTIGSAVSGATERAHADCEALFKFLWAADANLAVSGGRGLTAAADWSANKAIALPDQRGRLRVGVDVMGNASSDRLAGGLFAFGSASVLGSYGGEAKHIMTIAEMPAHPHSASSVAAGFPATSLQVKYTRDNIGGGGILPVVTSVGTGPLNGATDTGMNHTHIITTTITPNGGSAGFNQMPPFLLVTTYIRL